MGVAEAGGGNGTHARTVPLRALRGPLRDERDGDAIEGRTADYLRIVGSVIEAQREQLEELRRSGAISSDVMRRSERELDLEKGRFLG